MKRFSTRCSLLRRFGPVLLLVSSFMLGSLANAQVLQESRIKAGFITRFVDFIDWPEEQADKPAVIGVLGSPDFLGVLKQACAEQRARGREVEARMITGVEDLADVRVVFIAQGASLEWPTFSAVAEKNGVLIVADVNEESRLSNPPAMIQLKIVRNKVYFSIDLESAERARLVISSKLARLAVD